MRGSRFIISGMRYPVVKTSIWLGWIAKVLKFSRRDVAS